MKHTGKKFSNETVELDGNEFDGCTFENCHFIYQATASVTLANCSFVGFAIAFEGAAGSTLDFLSTLYHSGFKTLIEQTFNNIRAGKTPPTKWTVH